MCIYHAELTLILSGAIQKRTLPFVGFLEAGAASTTMVMVNGRDLIAGCWVQAATDGYEEFGPLSSTRTRTASPASRSAGRRHRRAHRRGSSCPSWPSRAPRYVQRSRHILDRKRGELPGKG